MMSQRTMWDLPRTKAEVESRGVGPETVANLDGSDYNLNDVTFQGMAAPIWINQTQGVASAPAGMDPELEEMIVNLLLGRGSFLNQYDNRGRDLDKECGYPGYGMITVEMYRRAFDRDPIANRVVNCMPSECWVVEPEVYEVERIDQQSAFEKAFLELPKSLKGQSWHEAQVGNLIWETLEFLDVMSGIGSYGILLIGIDDGKKLDQPVEGINPDGKMTSDQPAGDYKLTYLRVFDEFSAKVMETEPDQTNPRYGQPIYYNVNFVSPTQFSNTSESTKVHWTRVIHFGEPDGAPRMQAVYNNILNLQKLYGSSPEMYWRGAFPGMSIEAAEPGRAGHAPRFDAKAMRQQMSKFGEGLQRFITLAGAKAKMLAPTVVDPTPQIMVQIDAICIKMAVPKRIFMGSERGELASSQDAKSANKRVARRQNHLLTPRMAVAFIDRCIMMGVLPIPKKGYKVLWPDLEALSEEQKAAISEKRTNALVKFLAGGGQNGMTLKDYYVREMGFNSDEAQVIVDAAEKERKKREKEMADKMAAGLIPNPNLPNKDPLGAKNPDGTPPKPGPGGTAAGAGAGRGGAFGAGAGQPAR